MVKNVSFYSLPNKVRKQFKKNEYELPQFLNFGIYYYVIVWAVDLPCEIIKKIIIF